MIPLYTSPPETDQYGKCISYMWQRTSEQDSGSAVFVNINLKKFEISDYFSCLTLLKNSGLHVYIRISMDYGFAADLKSQISDYHRHDYLRK